MFHLFIPLTESFHADGCLHTRKDPRYPQRCQGGLGCSKHDIPDSLGKSLPILKDAAEADFGDLRDFGIPSPGNVLIPETKGEQLLAAFIVDS